MEYSPDEVEKLRAVAFKAVALAGLTATVVYITRNKETIAHLWHNRPQTRDFTLSLMKKGEKLVQIMGSVSASGKIGPEIIGDLDPSQIDELDEAIDQADESP